VPTGPQRLVLIRSGPYEYAEVELARGTLQIVGQNNAGKTTLINTLQFLYIDDRRHMDFGNFKPEETRDFYFLGRPDSALSAGAVKARPAVATQNDFSIPGHLVPRIFLMTRIRFVNRAT